MDWRIRQLGYTMLPSSALLTDTGTFLLRAQHGAAKP
jgi:hypothetical protein